jgi:hypothetical protein
MKQGIQVRNYSQKELINGEIGRFYLDFHLITLFEQFYLAWYRTRRYQMKKNLLH